MSHPGSSMKQTDLTMSRSRRDNPMFRSQFLNNSTHLDTNPEIIRSVFHNNPFQKYHQDITVYRPVSYKEPRSNSLSRSYKIVDQQVTYGKPLSAEEFERIIRLKQEKKEIITYGLQPRKDVRLNESIRIPVYVRRQAEVKKSGWCCCGNEPSKQKALISNYE